MKNQKTKFCHKKLKIYFHQRQIMSAPILWKSFCHEPVIWHIARCRSHEKKWITTIYWKSIYYLFNNIEQKSFFLQQLKTSIFRHSVKQSLNTLSKILTIFIFMHISLPATLTSSLISKQNAIVRMSVIFIICKLPVPFSFFVNCDTVWIGCLFQLRRFLTTYSITLSMCPTIPPSFSWHVAKNSNLKQTSLHEYIFTVLKKSVWNYPWCQAFVISPPCSFVSRNVWTHATTFGGPV